MIFKEIDGVALPELIVSPSFPSGNLGCMAEEKWGGGTVPQEGVIFVKFKLFPKCFFLVCMINLGHLTRVFSIKTFLFQFLCDIEASQFLNSQKIVKKLNFF